MIVSIWKILTQDAWLAEFMGLQLVGLMFLGIFLANDSMASIDTRSMDGRIYVGDHKTYIYKLWVSPFQRKRSFNFFPL